MTGEPQNQVEADNTGVKVPPSIVLILFILAGYGLQHVWTLNLPLWSGWPLLGWSLIGSAITILLAAWVHFYRAETDIRPDKPSSHIFRTGLYKYSRNPIYVCFLLLQAGIGLLMSNLWVLLLVPVAVLVLTKFVIAREEDYLERRFGDAYLNFKQSYAAGCNLPLS